MENKLNKDFISLDRVLHAIFKESISQKSTFKKLSTTKKLICIILLSILLSLYIIIDFNYHSEISSVFIVLMLIPMYILKNGMNKIERQNYSKNFGIEEKISNSRILSEKKQRLFYKKMKEKKLIYGNQNDIEMINQYINYLNNKITFIKESKMKFLGTSFITGLLGATIAIIFSEMITESKEIIKTLKFIGIIFTILIALNYFTNSFWLLIQSWLDAEKQRAIRIIKVLEEIKINLILFYQKN